MASTGRVDLDGNLIKSITISMIGAGGFICSHLYEKLMSETQHKVLAVDVYNNKIKHLLDDLRFCLEFEAIEFRLHDIGARNGGNGSNRESSEVRFDLQRVMWGLNSRIALGGKWGRPEEEAELVEDNAAAKSDQTFEAEVVEPSEVRVENDPWSD